MAKNKTKTAKFNPQGIADLPKNKPVVYKIKNQKGENIYTGVAKRGRVEARLKEHLPKGPDAIRGSRQVQIIQKDSIAEAKKSETNIINRVKPKYNKQGK